jgi:isopenicillin N synthase-like dioxygenase
VINLSNTDRYVFPVFYGPNHEAMIDCLPSCCGPGEPGRYPPISYVDLMSQYFLTRHEHGAGTAA